jgi:cytochrome c-type biogenesis protein CcmF
MLPEFGLFSLILAFGFAVLQVVYPIVLPLTLRFAQRSNARGEVRFSPRYLAYAQAFFVTLAFAILIFSFLSNDFSVAYVAENSNTHLPWFYKIGAVWGAHEGSLLLWIFILNVWTVALCLFSTHLEEVIVGRLLAVLGFVSVGFLGFSLFTSNPFLRLLPIVPSEGSDLNAILQDPGLMFHPPMLYMGYVGFAVAFAFAITALWSGRWDAQWARFTRPWTLTAWIFLSVGIVSGSAWAYRQLGWGGFWFWDPVENASFMPWLIGTALIHSLSVTEKRNALQSWTILLAIFTFSFSLIGTFLVRSGILSSVHAFAVDPKRGLYILIFLMLVIGGSLTLYAFRAETTRSHRQFTLGSRESFLLANNIFLAVAAFTVLLGTLYPLILQSLNGEKISVGPPYFNFIFSVLLPPMFFLMALSPFTGWQSTFPRFRLSLILFFILSIICATLLPYLFTHQLFFGVSAGVFLSAWIIFLTVKDWFDKTAKFTQWKNVSLRYYGMVIAHIGVAVCLLGIVLVSNYSVEADVRLSIGQSVIVGNQAFSFATLNQVQGPNYTAIVAEVLRSEDNKIMETIITEKRIYTASNVENTKAGISSSFFGDRYIALGDEYTDNSWSFRIYLKPFIRWIWVGGLLMALGGLFALISPLPLRERSAQKRRVRGTKI